MTHAELYIEVQEFYARQIRLHDTGRIEEWAATFTEDGQIQHLPEHAVDHRVGKSLIRGRAELADAMKKIVKRLAEDKIQQRHWYTTMTVEPRDDGAIETSFYAVVNWIKRGGKPVPEVHTHARDVLVRDGNGNLRVHSRTLKHDEFE
jgi:actinorhodin biosynthesis protein ActVIA